MSQNSKRKFTREFKEEVVKLVTEQGYKISEAARGSDIGVNVLGWWKKEFEDESNGYRLLPD